MTAQAHATAQRAPAKPDARPAQAFSARKAAAPVRPEVRAPTPSVRTRAVDYAFSRMRVYAGGPLPLPDGMLPDLPAGLRYTARQARLHDDAFAHRATEALNVEAVTAGDHVYFNRGRWRPETAAGRALLQHELDHVSRGEGRGDTVEAWTPRGHRTITREALANDARYSVTAVSLLANTAPTPDYNRPQILQDMVEFWAGKSPMRAPLGALGGGIIGAITPPEQGTQVGNVQISGILPQAVLGTGLISTIPSAQQSRGPTGAPRGELARTRVPQELANHGEDLPERNAARMQQYVSTGVATANSCDLYNGLVRLGYALHIAQDRGSHGDGYTQAYVYHQVEGRTVARPHNDIDDMASNPEGLALALQFSHEAVDDFFNGLTEVKKQALASPLTPLSDQPPPILGTILQPPTMPSVPTGAPQFGPQSGPQPGAGGVNIFTIRF
jgi:hypothetical protein